MFYWLYVLDKPIAGIPSHRHDLKNVKVGNGQCTADKENFGDETTVNAVVNPSIYTNYGLSHRDFFMVN